MKNLTKLLLIITFIALICIISSLLFIMSNSIINFSYSNISLIDKSEKNSPIYYINLYGENFDKYSAELDLSNVIADENLPVLLENFPKLKRVILKNQSISKELQYNLEKLYPNINFEWDVSILDKKIDNTVDTLDLSKSTINDLEDFKNSLKLLHNLKYLDMSDYNLSNETLATLRNNFPKIKIAWRIRLGKLIMIFFF